MKKILCLGHATYDITYLVDEFPKENKKYRATDRILCGGGPSCNAAYLLGKYGQDVSYVTTLGGDSYGYEILDDFKKVGVDTSNVIVKSDYVTPCSIIISNSQNGSRTIVNYRIPNDLPKDYTFQYDTSPEIILFDGHEMGLVKKALAEFKNSITVLDAGTFKPEMLELASIVNYLVCSEDFTLSYTGFTFMDESNFEAVFLAMERLNSNVIVITLGERGCLYKEEGKVKLHPSIKVNAVDSTGAGDIFHGAFVYGLRNKFSLVKNLEFSSVCAALSVEKLGGRVAIPELGEVIANMRF